MINYDEGKGPLKNWIVTESDFKRKFQGKCETIFCLGNGYMGIRSSTEEKYIGQVRDFFVAGTFNKCADNEVTELPNAADFIGIDIYINDELFSLVRGSFRDYKRTLNLKTGELQRTFIWKDVDEQEYEFTFKRMISMADRHLLAMDISIKPLNKAAHILIKSGIDGQVTNTGAQHFDEGEKRIYDRQYLQMLQQTTESKLDFVHNTYHDFTNCECSYEHRFEMDRRKVLMVYEAQVEPNQAFSFSKISNVYTTRDKDVAQLDVQGIRTFSIEELKTQGAKGFDGLLAESAAEWASFWAKMDITIHSDDDFNQLAIRFAQYHLFIMTPRHDNRYGIGAKGLSGEGYKGHSFWDTELFMLPFFTYTFPEIAKSLLEYRFNTLGGARKKAKENGYKGAMYPWESAWADDGEVTPVWGAADIITGKSTKIWSGFIEQHITSDVAFAVWQYYQITGDEDFMERCGYEILLDTGIFWSSRLEWNEEKQRFHINDVVGPDEYKEHVDNDAFTNHTAHWCMENAIYYYNHLKAEKPAIFERLNEKLNLAIEIPEVIERSSKMYVPQPNEDGVIPQNDTFLQLKKIDLTKYKQQKHVGLIFRDYNLHQINNIQVSKQASNVMLMYLLEHKFSQEVKAANYNYYEPLTLHDSSLSLSTHAVLAADLGKIDLAYDIYRRAADIDLGTNMKSSDHGIHSASLGGVWQIIVCGFGGVRMVGGALRINPNLPPKIKSIHYPIYWKGNRLEVEASHNSLKINTESAHKIELTVNGKAYSFTKKLEVNW